MAYVLILLNEEREKQITNIQLLTINYDSEKNICRLKCFAVGDYIFYSGGFSK